MNAKPEEENPSKPLSCEEISFLIYLCGLGAGFALERARMGDVRFTNVADRAWKMKDRLAQLPGEKP